MPYNPNDDCPDCGKPKSKAAVRCRKCAGKHGYNRTPRPTNPAWATGQCQCGQPGRKTTIGLPDEQTTLTLCKQHAAEAYRNYEHHVKNTALKNLTQQIKAMTP